MCGRFTMIPREVVERIVREVEAGLPIGEVEVPVQPERPVAPRQLGLFDVQEDGPILHEPSSLPAAGADAFPGARVSVVVPGFDAGRLAVTDLNWGYPVTWSKRPVFNTRVDTATGPRGEMWRESLARRRCAVPTLGFYEPHKTVRSVSPKTGREIKAQCAFTLPESPVTFLAGIYEDDHFSIMTCEPNRWVNDVHDRMPLVLRPSELEAWLGPRYADLFDRRDVELACRMA